MNEEDFKLYLCRGIIISPRQDRLRHWRMGVEIAVQKKEDFWACLFKAFELIVNERYDSAKPFLKKIEVDYPWNPNVRDTPILIIGYQFATAYLERRLAKQSFVYLEKYHATNNPRDELEKTKIEENKDFLERYVKSSKNTYISLILQNRFAQEKFPVIIERNFIKKLKHNYIKNTPNEFIAASLYSLGILCRLEGFLQELKNPKIEFDWIEQFNREEKFFQAAIYMSENLKFATPYTKLGHLFLERYGKLYQHNWLSQGAKELFRETIKFAEKAIDISSKYLFCWDKIPGGDSERLIDFLKQNYSIDSVRTDKIKKIEDGKTIILSVEKKYLFCWDEIPENDSKKLIDFLKKNYGIDRVKTDKIKKIEDDKTIILSVEKKYPSLSLNNEKTKINLKIDRFRNDELLAKSENGKLKIYENNYPSLSLNNEKSKVNLKIDRFRNDELLAKSENGKLNIYNSYYSDPHLDLSYAKIMLNLIETETIDLEKGRKELIKAVKVNPYDPGVKSQFKMFLNEMLEKTDDEKIKYQYLYNKLVVPTIGINSQLKNWVMGEQKSILKTENKDTLLILKRWSSYSPILTRGPGSKTYGGGYLLNWAGRWIAIDPGVGFLEQMYAYGVSPSDLDAIAITHDHTDHQQDMQPLIAAIKEQDNRFSDHRNKIKRPLYFLLTTSSYERWWGRLPTFDHRKPELKRLRAGNRPIQLFNNQVSVKATKTFGHFDLGDVEKERDRGQIGTGVGLIFNLKENNKVVNRIGITGDTAYHDSNKQKISPFFKKCDIIIVHISTVDDLDSSKTDKLIKPISLTLPFSGFYGFYKKHLGFWGTISFLKDITEIDSKKYKNSKKKLILLNEFGEELSLVRESVAREIENYLESPYKFKIDEVSGNDSDRFIQFVKKNYDININWIKSAKIIKNSSFNTILFYTQENSLSFTFNPEIPKVILEINDNTIDEFYHQEEKYIFGKCFECYSTDIGTRISLRQNKILCQFGKMCSNCASGKYKIGPIRPIENIVGEDEKITTYQGWRDRKLVYLCHNHQWVFDSSMDYSNIL